MNTIITVFRKELIDTIRDRRTLIVMVVIPMLLFPIMFKIESTKLNWSQVFNIECIIIIFNLIICNSYLCPNTTFQ